LHIKKWREWEMNKWLCVFDSCGRKDEHSLRVLRRMFGGKREEDTRERRKFRSEELQKL
jgi:hypothetical protein